jgi:hypothetical protein
MVGSDTPSKYVSRTLAVLGKQQQIGAAAFVTALANLVQDAHAEHKVFTTPLLLEPLPDRQTKAYFSPIDWKISVNSNSCPDPLSRDQAIDLAAKIFHEARHAEQWFTMIRYVIFTKLDAALRQAQVPRAVTLKIPAPDAVVMAAFVVSTKKDFDDKDKSAWAAWLFESSVSPAEGVKVAALSPALLAGEAGPNEKVPAFRAIEAQKGILDNPTNHTYPLATDHWLEWAPHAQKSWAECMLAVAPHWPVADLGPLPAPFTDAECGGLLGMVKSNLVTLPPGAATAVANARDGYVKFYGKLLGLELKEASARYDEAYRQYRLLPVEQDAFEAQDVVEKLFRDAAK